jgi:TonB family protein
MFSLALALLLPSAAAPQIQSVTGGWEIRRENGGCMAILKADAPAGALFYLERVPGHDETDINFLDPAWKRSPVKDPAALSVIIDAETVPSTEGYFTPPSARGVRPIDRSSLVVTVQGRSFLPAFAAAHSIAFRDGSREVVRTALPAAAAAVAALEACEREALTKWGVDWVRMSSLRSAPIPHAPLARLLNDGDYPAAARRAGAQGLTIVRLEVDARGRIGRCATASSSGNMILDRTSCELLSRGRFNPALDAEGRAVAAPYFSRVVWSLSP